MGEALGKGYIYVYRHANWTKTREQDAVQWLWETASMVIRAAMLMKSATPWATAKASAGKFPLADRRK